MKALAEQQKVFGFIGNVGTPTAAVAIPYALEKKTLFFGAFTGAPLLRKDPPDRYVFNYRASYAEETAAAVKYLIEVRRIKPYEIAVFAQNDKYGDAGFEGVARMLRRYRRDPSKILRVGYERNTADVHGAVSEILRNLQRVRAVVMVPTYRAAAQFVVNLKDKGADLIFTSVSFVGSNAFAEELMQLGKSYAEGVIVTQVVPLPDSKSSVVLRYQELLNKYAPGEKPDFVSLEGYIAATLLIEALNRTGPELNTETLVATLEGLRGLDLGLGAQINYGPSEHQASHKVWGAVLDAKGVYQNLELD
jgi:ABC-type branched-subunit amino acid transport system substrate-binding protein